VRALDTNILLRFIIDDDPAQSAAAERVLSDSIGSHERLFISLPVLCEFVWMLQNKKLEQSKVIIVAAIQSLVNDGLFQIEARPQVNAALDLYRQGKAGFVDYLIGELAQRAGCRDTVTFDRALRGSPGFTIL
jgi:predicted nucleic-acid-binding protein